MKQRYSILVREYGSDHEVELLQCNDHPEAIVKGLQQKKLTIERSIFDKGARRYKTPKYTSVRIVENKP